MDKQKGTNTGFYKTPEVIKYEKKNPKVMLTDLISIAIEDYKTNPEGISLRDWISIKDKKHTNRILNANTYDSILEICQSTNMTKSRVITLLLHNLVVSKK